MTALVTPAILEELEQERGYALNPNQKCRFCQCSEFAPCAIPLREDEDGLFWLARSEEESAAVLACSWFLPDVCSSPHCIEKLLAESRGKVILFDGRGERAL